MQISSLNENTKRLQQYNTIIEIYNMSLKSDLATSNETLKRVEKEKADVVEALRTSRGQNTLLQEQLTTYRV